VDFEPQFFPKPFANYFFRFVFFNPLAANVPQQLTDVALPRLDDVAFVVASIYFFK
jgi:hypothetical protein